jgi:hypothetical protein
VESATGTADHISFEVRPFPLRTCACGATREGVLKPGVLQDGLIAKGLYVWFGDRDRDTCRRCGAVIEASATRALADFDLQLSPQHLKTIDIRMRLPSVTCPSCRANLVDADTTFVTKSSALEAAWEQLVRASPSPQR